MLHCPGGASEMRIEDNNTASLRSALRDNFKKNLELTKQSEFMNLKIFQTK